MCNGCSTFTNDTICRLTGSASLRPLNRLFATLHTSEHSARLPSGRIITLADTIGNNNALQSHFIFGKIKFDSICYKY